MRSPPAAAVRCVPGPVRVRARSGLGSRVSAPNRVLTILVAALVAGAVSAECVRPPLPTPPGPVVVVHDVASLRAAVARANAKGNLTIALDDGEYRLKRPLGLSGDGITIRGLSGDRDRVVVRGEGMGHGISHVFQVTGKRVTLADLTAGWATRHVVQVHAENDADDFHAYNVRFVDGREQIFKVSYRRGGPQADRGIVEWCLFEFTEGHAYQSYTGGLGALGAKDWTVRHNVFRNIRVAPGTEGQATAIMFRRGAEGTRVESNVIIDADSGIRFGLLDDEHGPGRIVNNTVRTVRDVGISLEKAHGVVIAHNTVWTEGYPNAIEYRFPRSRDNLIVDNLLHGTIQRRDGGSARLERNIEYARADWFVDAARGDLRLARGVSDVVDRALPVAGVDEDGECEPRPTGAGPDIGADEYQGFAESGSGLLAGWRRLTSYLTRLPERVLYWGAPFRRYLVGTVVAGVGAVLALAGALLVYGWLGRRDRRWGRPRRRLRNATGALVVALVVAGSAAMGYLTVRHGLRGGIALAVNEGGARVYRIVRWVLAPSVVDPTPVGGITVYHREEAVELGRLDHGLDHDVPLGIEGASGLKVAFQARGYGEARRVPVNMYDLVRGDNTTAPGYAWVDEGWRTIVYHVDDFVYNANPTQAISANTRFADLRFHHRPALGQLEVRNLIVYRGDDAIPPSVPARLVARATPEGVGLEWTSSRDNVGIALYVVSRADGAAGFEKVGETVDTGYIDHPQRAGRYRYRVLAADVEDNLSGWSEPAEVELSSPAARAGQGVRTEPWFARSVREVHARGQGWVHRGEALLFGDSLTGATNYRTETEGALGRYRVRARGRAGWTTARGLKVLAKDLDELRPELCLILYGTNNSKRSERAIRAGVDDIRAMVRLAKERGVVPVVGTIPPRGFDDPQSRPEAAFNAALIAMLVEEGVPVADIFEEFQHQPDRRKLLASDGVHWGGNGFGVAARAWGKAVRAVRYVLLDGVP